MAPRLADVKYFGEGYLQALTHASPLNSGSITARGDLFAGLRNPTAEAAGRFPRSQGLTSQPYLLPACEAAVLFLFRFFRRCLALSCVLGCFEEST